MTLPLSLALDGLAGALDAAATVAMLIVLLMGRLDGSCEGKGSAGTRRVEMRERRL